MLYSVVQCCTVLYSAVQCCTVLYSVVQCCILVLYSVVQCWCCTVSYIVLKRIFTVETCCQRKTITWVKHKLLNFKKEDTDEMPFTFSCNVGKIWGTEPPTKEFLLCLRCLLLQNNFFSQKTRELVWSSQFKSCKNSIYVGIKYQCWEILVQKTFEIRCSPNQLFSGGGLNIPPNTAKSSVFLDGICKCYGNFACFTAGGCLIIVGNGSKLNYWCFVVAECVLVDSYIACPIL